jgi:hypothetical protein
VGLEKLGHYIRKKINGRKIMGLPRRFAPRNDRGMDSHFRGNDKEESGNDI